MEILAEHYQTGDYIVEEPTDPAFAPTDTKGIAHQRTSSDRDESELRAMRLAMRLSLTFGVLMLIGKLAAYLMTGSAAILSDAAESVVHAAAVAFAAFSLRLSTRPCSPQIPLRPRKDHLLLCRF